MNEKNIISNPENSYTTRNGEYEIFQRPQFIPKGDYIESIEKIEAISIVGLGGTGNRILCKQFRSNHYVRGLRACIGFDTSEEITDQCELYRTQQSQENSLYKFFILKGRWGKPVARIFPLSEYVVDSILSDETDSSDGKVALNWAFKREIGTSDSILFTPFGAGGGVGHGILRSKFKKLDSDIHTRIVPIVILPSRKLKRPRDQLNACAAYDFITNNERKWDITVFVDNDSLSLSNSDKTVDIETPDSLANKRLSECLKVITSAVKIAISKGAEIHIAGVLSYLSHQNRVSTFGYGSTSCFGDGVESTRRALYQALQENLLLNKPSDYSGCTVAVFALIPFRTKRHILKNIINDYLVSTDINVAGIFVAPVQSYSIDIVVWIAGDFEPQISHSLRIESPSENIVEERINEFRKYMVKELQKQESTVENLLDEARRNFSSGLKKLGIM